MARIELEAMQPHGAAAKVIFDCRVDTCPICHHAIEPRTIAASLRRDDGSETNELEIVFRCTRLSCCRLFLGEYARNHSTGYYHLIRSKPVTPKEPAVPAEIAELSPDFRRIYAQAVAAEEAELDEIAGSGFRRALEFLVKDYCASKDPDSAEAIRGKFLGSCINDHIDDANIKECARRAAWLGNDQSHYVRRWEDKDLQDLKILIELTMGWIRSNILTERYLGEMVQ